MPTIRSRVDCGFSLVMLNFCPTTRLRSVDLPALGRPTTVTIPARVMGARYSRPAVLTTRRPAGDHVLRWRAGFARTARPHDWLARLVGGFAHGAAGGGSERSGV